MLHIKDNTKVTVGGTVEVPLEWVVISPTQPAAISLFKEAYYGSN